MHSRILISGRLIEPADDKPRSGVTLTLSSVKNSSAVLKHATYQCVTGGNGEYSFNAAPGTYAVSVSVYGAEPERVGQISVYSDSVPGDLNGFLTNPVEDDLTPEIIRRVDRMRREAVEAAELAKLSEQIAIQSVSEVAAHTQQTVSHAQQVAADAHAVSQARDKVVAKTRIAQAAADTATQKAASAAEHDAAAAEYARQAQEAAQATAGALMDGGAADLSRGIYPQPVLVSGTSRPTFWKVTKGGIVGGVEYGVGDTLIYTVAGSGSYYKIDNTEAVTSVQGKNGAVTLTPEEVGAESVGTAAAIVQQHSEAPDPHSQYAKKTEVDPKGMASEKVNEHASKSDAHQISGIVDLQQVLDSKYSPSNLPIANISFNSIFTCYNGWYVDDVESIGIEFPAHYLFQLTFRHLDGAPPGGELGVFNRNVSCSFIPYYSGNGSYYLKPILPEGDNRLFTPTTHLDGQYWLMLTLLLLKV